MVRLSLVIIYLVSATAVDAAWYQKTDGTKVDPIMSIHGSLHSYSGANLTSWAYLSGAYLSYADLPDANLNFAYMDSADLVNADATGANLSSAYLVDADFSGATLTDADFSGAELEGAKFTGAIDPPNTNSQLALTPLEQTIVGGAQLYGANFSGADLSGAVFNHEDDTLDVVGWETATWIGAHFHYRDVPHLPTGMIFKDHGIVARTPEPRALLLALFGLVLLLLRRRR